MWEGPLPQQTLNKVDLDINDINLWLRLDTQGLPMPYCKIRSNTDYHSTYYLSINMIYLYLSILIIYVVYFLSDPIVLELVDLGTWDCSSRVTAISI